MKTILLASTSLATHVWYPHHYQSKFRRFNK